ncbi:hypothetical protein VOLCADRAFT_99385, partial [Volvox carteri f. nagariensis]
YNDICWKGAPDNFQGLENHFPSAEFVFGDNARLSLPPLRYLFVSRPGEYCLGVFDNGGSGTLIGGVSVRDVVVTMFNPEALCRNAPCPAASGCRCIALPVASTPPQYDRRNGRVGLTTMPCEEVAADLASRPNSTPAPGNVTLLASPPPSEAKTEQPPPPSSPSARVNFTAAQDAASRAAGVVETSPSEPPLAFSRAALNINFAVIIGVSTAIAALFTVGEVVFLGRSTLGALTTKIVERFSGQGSSRLAPQDEAEATPLTDIREDGHRTDVEAADMAAAPPIRQ